MKEFLIKDKEQMISLAKQLANIAKAGDIFALKGSLGAGKSFFAKAFIRSLMSANQEVLSPTFNLVYSYSSNKGLIYHFDLYRLKSPFELENIGFFEALKSGICLIEWPEIAAQYFPKNYCQIEILFGKNNDERIVRIL